MFREEEMFTELVIIGGGIVSVLNVVVLYRALRTVRPKHITISGEFGYAPR